MAAPAAILLSGWVTSGKDAVGGFLAPYGFRRYAFADALKDEVAELYRLNRAAMDTQVGKLQTITLQSGETTTVRGLLIAHGQMRRAEDPDYWVKKTLVRIASDKCVRVVVTDWRFPNEETCFRRSFAGDIHTVRVSRLDAPPLLDESEVALDTFPFASVIENKSNDLAMLKTDVHRWVFQRFQFDPMNCVKDVKISSPQGPVVRQMGFQDPL